MLPPDPTGCSPAPHCRGCLALHTAACSPLGLAVLRPLLLHGGHVVGAVSHAGDTALQVARAFGRTGGRNRALAAAMADVLHIAGEARGERVAMHPLIRRHVRSLLTTVLLCIRRIAGEEHRLGHQPVEMWLTILRYVPGRALLATHWATEAEEARRAEARKLRLRSVRAAAAESMALFESICDVEAIDVRQPPRRQGPLRAASAVDLPRASSEAPARLDGGAAPRLRRGLPPGMLPSDSESESEEEADRGPPLAIAPLCPAFASAAAATLAVPPTCTRTDAGVYAEAAPWPRCRCELAQCTDCGAACAKCAMADHRTACRAARRACPVCHRHVPTARLATHLATECRRCARPPSAAPPWLSASVKQLLRGVPGLSRARAALRAGAAQGRVARRQAAREHRTTVPARVGGVRADGPRHLCLLPIHLALAVYVPRVDHSLPEVRHCRPAPRHRGPSRWWPLHGLHPCLPVRSRGGAGEPVAPQGACRPPLSGRRGAPPP